MRSSARPPSKSRVKSSWKFRLMASNASMNRSCAVRVMPRRAFSRSRSTSREVVVLGAEEPEALVELPVLLVRDEVDRLERADPLRHGLEPRPRLVHVALGIVGQAERVGVDLEPAPRIGLEILPADSQLGQADGVLLDRPARPVEVGLGRPQLVRGTRDRVHALPHGLRRDPRDGLDLGLARPGRPRPGRRACAAPPNPPRGAPAGVSSRSSPLRIRSCASASSLWFRTRSDSIVSMRPASAASSTWASRKACERRPSSCESTSIRPRSSVISDATRAAVASTSASIWRWVRPSVSTEAASPRSWATSERTASSISPTRSPSRTTCSRSLDALSRSASAASRAVARARWVSSSAATRSSARRPRS